MAFDESTSKAVASVVALLTLAVCYFLGVVFFYEPIAASDAAAGPLVPQPVAFAVSIVLYIGLFVWVADQMGNGLKAALTVALSQFLLVNVDNVLAGKRGIATAGASTLLLLVSWTAVGLVYDRLRPGSPTSPSPDPDARRTPR